MLNKRRHPHNTEGESARKSQRRTTKLNLSHAKPKINTWSNSVTTESWGDGTTSAFESKRVTVIDILFIVKRQLNPSELLASKRNKTHRHTHTHKLCCIYGNRVRRGEWANDWEYSQIKCATGSPEWFWMKKWKFIKKDCFDIERQRLFTHLVTSTNWVSSTHPSHCAMEF